MAFEQVDRRSFIGTSAAGLGYFFTADAYSATRAADGPNGKVHIAGIGVGGKGSSDIDHAGNLGEVVALCDINDNNMAPKAKKWATAKTYTDFRKMLDEMGKQIDAVTVSTPDHTHSLAAILAMKQKKHVYCQKPLTHSVFEARHMRLVAKKEGVCTQMGNQGTAENGLRRAVELIQSGIIGNVTEMHVWTNRPVWPQAPEILARPTSSDAPKHIHWEEFIGPAPMRPYGKYTPAQNKKNNNMEAYASFNWRGWWDFGTGALGDMACHTANMAFMALKLGSPTSIVAESTDLNSETCPSSARVTFEFPARGQLVPVTFRWYEGKLGGKRENGNVTPNAELMAKVLKPNEKIVDSGSILVGDKGILYSPNDYGAKFRLVGGNFEGLNLDEPEKLPKNGKQDQGQKNEWFEAIKANKPEVALSNFDYAAMLTETILLGNVAIRTGKKLMWDAEKMVCTGCPEASQYIRTEARKGWGIDDLV